jgi:hypothetical protein
MRRLYAKPKPVLVALDADGRRVPVVKVKP